MVTQCNFFHPSDFCIFFKTNVLSSSTTISLMKGILERSILDYFIVSQNFYKIIKVWKRLLVGTLFRPITSYWPEPLSSVRRCWLAMPPVADYLEMFAGVPYDREKTENLICTPPRTHSHFFSQLQG